MDANAITEAEFQRIQQFVKRESGIHLTPAKKSLVVGRLAKRLRALGLKTYGDYYELVVAGTDPDEKDRMLDSLCTNETHFFREAKHFEFLERSVFPVWRQNGTTGRIPRHIRVWSAACSTGEEPATIAMVLLRNFPPDSGWSLEVLGTDLSTHAIQRARAGVWSIEKSTEIPEVFRKAYMLRGTGPRSGEMKAGPEVRAITQFQRLNLCAEKYPVSGAFDLVFCRNVIIYFDWETKRRVVDQLLNHLSPLGYFLSGHAESLNDLTHRVRGIIPTVYVPVDVPAWSPLRPKEAA